MVIGKIDMMKLERDIKTFLTQKNYHPMKADEIAQHFGVSTQEVMIILRRLRAEDKVQAKFSDRGSIVYSIA